MTDQNPVGGRLHVIHNDHVIAEGVSAEDLKVGDQICLSTQFGARAVRLTSIEGRATGIRFTGVDEGGARNSFGFRREEIVLRAQPASCPEDLT